VEQNVVISDEKSCEQIINELIEKYNTMVFNLIYKITTNYDDALELTQETFLKAFQALPGFRFESSMKTWIYKIAVNVALNYKRKTKLFHKKEDPLLDASLKDKDHSPEENASQGQMRDRILHAFDELPPDMKAMVLLREIEELTYEEIAQVLSLPIGTVKSRLARARCYLKKSLSTYYRGDKL